MTFSKKIKIHWPSALLSVLLALTVCFAIAGRERVETWIDVRLEIKDVPEGYVLMNGNSLPSSVEVRLRGPSGLIRNLAGQNMPMLISLSNIEPGYNLINLDGNDLPLSGAFDILEINPNAVEIDVDQIVEKEVKLEARSTHNPPPGIRKIELILPQNTILLTGPRKVLEKITKVEALVSLPASILSRELILPSYISLPQGVKASPSHLNVRLQVEGEPKEMIVQRSVSLTPSTSQQKLKVNPPAVTITLQVPFDWNEKNPALSRIEAVVELPGNELPQKPLKLPVKINLPKEVKVLSIKPENVTVELTDGFLQSSRINGMDSRN